MTTLDWWIVGVVWSLPVWVLGLKIYLDWSSARAYQAIRARLSAEDRAVFDLVERLGR